MRISGNPLIPCGRVLFSALLLTLPGAAVAAPFTYAEYYARINAVTAPNQPQSNVVTAHDLQRWDGPQPAEAAVISGPVAGTSNTLGAAGGSVLAVASPGVLRAVAIAESQAVRQPNTFVGASAIMEALAQFRDSLVFTAGQPVYQNLLIVSGNLVLTGDMSTTAPASNASGSVDAEVGGTGLHPSDMGAEWIGEPGRQKSATGVYSPWTPGDPVLIPFRFSAYSGQAIDVTYWLQVHATSSSSFGSPCPALGGTLCDVVEISANTSISDYGHTLAWGGVSVTDWFGSAVDFDVSSSSGFDYSQAYVPEPGTASLLIVGLGWLGRRARRRNSR